MQCERWKKILNKKLTKNQNSIGRKRVANWNKDGNFGKK